MDGIHYIDFILVYNSAYNYLSQLSHDPQLLQIHRLPPHKKRLLPRRLQNQTRPLLYPSHNSEILGVTKSADSK